MDVKYRYRLYSDTATVNAVTLKYLDTEIIDVYAVQGIQNEVYLLNNTSTITLPDTIAVGIYYKYKDSAYNNPLNDSKLTCIRNSVYLHGAYDSSIGYFRMIRNDNNNFYKQTNTLSYKISEISAPISQSTTFDIDLTAVATLNNCTLQETSISGNYGDSKTITINTNTGYTFDSSNLPTITISGVSNNLTLSTDKTQATYTLTVDNTTDITAIIASAVNALDFDIDLSALSTLTHCTLENTSISGHYGDSKTITIDSDTGYFFNVDNLPTITINETSYNLTLSSDKTQASYTLTIENTTSINNIVAVAIVRYYKDLSAISTLVQCTITPTIIDVPLNTDVTITLTATSGYYFSDTPTITINEYMIGWQSHDFTLNSDRTIGTYIYHVAQATASIEDIKAINGDAIQQTVISDKYGLITLYKPTSSILQELPEIMLYYKGTDLIDLSQYITNFISMPLDIETVGSKSITFNGVDTEITCSFINDNIVSLDFGTCNITGFYNNSIDINNCEVEIYLPYLSNQKLDTSKVMNKTIHLVYKVDLFTGDFIAIIKIDTLIIYTFTGNMAIKIPYIIKTMQGKNTSIYDSNSLSLLDDREPKIIVNENIINNNSLYIDTVNYCKLDTLTGYNVINDIELDETNIMADDIENIKNILSSGIIL